MERILFISDDPWQLGPTYQSIPIAGALAARGWAVEFVQLNTMAADNRTASSAPAVGLSGIVKRHSLPWGGRIHTTTIGQLRNLVHRFRPSLIHAFGTCSAIAAVLARSTDDQRIVISRHKSDRSGTTAGRLRWLEKRAVSRASANLIHQAGTIGSSHSAELPNSVTLPWGWPQAAANSGESLAPELKRILDIPLTAKLVGVVAPLQANTRLKDVVWAADLVTCIRKDVYWLIIGDGPQRWRLERFAGHVATGRNLRFLGWHPQTCKLVESMDAYVQPSDCFTDGNGLMAAMASGVPLIATSNPLHRTFVRHGQNGYAIEPGARNEMARCVNRLVNQPDLAQRMGNRGRELLASEFCFDNLLERLCEIYSPVETSRDFKRVAA